MVLKIFKFVFNIVILSNVILGNGGANGARSFRFRFSRKAGRDKSVLS